MLEPPLEAAVSSWRLALGVTIIMTVAVAPVFLTGAAAVLIQPELDFGRSALGIAVAVFFAVMSVTSLPGGRLSERFGARRMLLVAGSASMVALLGLAATARSWWSLTAWMVVAGVACGCTLPAASHALTAGVSSRQGLLFGLKQSAPPLATLLAGISVPLIGLSIGWRWSFLVVACCALGGIALLPRRIGDPPSKHRAQAPDLPYGPLIAVSAASGLGSTAAIAMGAFFVLSAVDGGLSKTAAGGLLALGSFAGISARLLVGWNADRRATGHLQTVAWMLGIAAIGYLALSAQGGTLLTGAGVVVGYGFGYGWPGLLFFAVVRACPSAPASATGLVNTGATAGAALGPAVFGLVADSASFSTAWILSAVATAVSAVLLLAAAPRLTASSAVTTQTG
jgi:predicted MFS family arabinose efflux permease